MLLKADGLIDFIFMLNSSKQMAKLTHAQQP